MGPRLALLGTLLLAFALRVYGLPAQSLWYDEGVSWYMTRMPLPALTVWTANDIQPPLYYYLLWPWVRLAGTSEFALRFPSVFFGTLTVPLLWVMARRLLGKRAAWLSVLLLTLSPLHVYYAQEARMYTLLTFLGLMSSFLLLRMLNLHSANLRTPIVWAYILITAAALYTHYFAFFLLAAQALYIVYRWWGQGRSRLPGLAILTPFSILLLYLPWLPFLLTRYGADASFWSGPLKLDEVTRKLFIAFSLGETVTEQAGLWLSIGYGLILLAGLAALWRSIRYATRNTQYAARGACCVLRKESLVFLLVYLAVPVALVLLLAIRTPKFNPRYAMFSSPAFILLIAGGLSELWAASTREQEVGIGHYAIRNTQFATRTIFSFFLLYILATSAYSLSNWFSPQATNLFNKADFRATAQVVRERIGPDETVLLSSGHMFPAWAYYYGWEGWHRLPDSEILDVNAVLDLSAGDELSRLLHGQRGVWLVRWQNEVTDPFDVLPLYLGTVGVRDYHNQFWHVDLAHYTLPPDAHFDAASFITQRAGADFAGKVTLLGLRQTPHAGLILFWQATAAIDADYTVFVHLLDAEDKTLANADHLPLYPTHLWRPGQAVPDPATLKLPAGLAPGDYRLEVGFYNAADRTLPRLPLADGSGDRVILPLHLEADDLE
jgi:4-amino-4-deoxy-L-arabinose transferase-like glycosyltransferase